MFGGLVEGRGPQHHVTLQVHGSYAPLTTSSATSPGWFNSGISDAVLAAWLTQYSEEAEMSVYI